MNFLEICQMVLDEADLAPDELQDVRVTAEMPEQHRKVIAFVKRNYLAVQREMPYWDFHQTSGVFLTTLTDETQDYTVSNVRDLMRDSLRGRKVGQTAEWPIRYLTYAEWRDIFMINNSGTGIPLYLVELPDGQFRVEPKPTVACEVLADWTQTLHELRRKDDEPLWHKDYHELLVWMSLEDYASAFEVGDTLGQRIARNLPKIKLAFNQKFSPELEGAGGFM